MDNINWRLAFLSGLIFLWGCNVSSSDCDAIIYNPIIKEGEIRLVDKYTTSFVEKLYKEHPFNNNIVYCLSSDSSAVYLNYISKDGLFIHANLLDSTKVSFSPVRFIPSSLVDMSFKNDSIYLLDQENKKFYTLTRQSNNEFSSSIELDLSSAFKNTYSYIHFSLQSSQFYYEKPLLYFVIGDLRGPNYLGEESLMIYNIETGVFSTACSYPKCFTEHYIRSEHTHFNPISKNKILVSYNFLDIVQCFDSSNRIRFEVLPNHTEPIREFDKKKNLNAAYVRKYEVTSDMNLGVMSLDSIRFLVFRKSSTQHVNDTANYYCNYFKNDGKSRSEIKIDPVAIRNIIKFRQGFFVLSIDMKSCELYECL